jgi:hypothetical protein
MRGSAAVFGLLAMALVTMALVVAAASGGAVAPNVKGTFVRSTTTMSCYPGEPCDQPPQAAFLVFARNGHSTRARLGAHGAFAVRLGAGLYRVSVRPSHGSSVRPATVRVPAVGVIHLRFVQRATS